MNNTEPTLPTINRTVLVTAITSIFIFLAAIGLPVSNEIQGALFGLLAAWTPMLPIAMELYRHHKESMARARNAIDVAMVSQPGIDPVPTIKEQPTAPLENPTPKF